MPNFKKQEIFFLKLLWLSSRQLNGISRKFTVSVSEFSIGTNQIYFCRMYSKQEAAALRQAFWTSFGQYMSPVPSAEGEKVNWVNYKTGVKDIRFRMESDNKKAIIAIELTHRDKGVRLLYFEQFQQLKAIFSSIAGDHWVWQPFATNEAGVTISKIYSEKTGISVFKKEDWPELISFFKERMVVLDRFWSEVKYSFESLR